MHFLNLACFYGRRTYALHPVLGCALLVAAVALAVASGYFLLQKDALRSAVALGLALQKTPVVPAVPLPAMAVLPEFHSVPLVQTIERSASQNGTSVNEIRFAFEESHTQPFLRYRASFSVVGKYFDIRAFTEDVNTTLPFAYLDKIHCSREDGVATDVVCAMTISAVYQRPRHE